MTTRIYSAANAIAAIGVLTLASWPAQAAGAPPFDVIVDNPVSLNPNTANPVTIVNPPNAPSTVSLNPTTPNPVTPTVNSYQDFGLATCPAGGSCTVSFSAVTVETLIRHASCNFLLPTGASVFNAVITSGGRSGPPFNFVQPFTTGVSVAGGLMIWGFNVDTYLFVAKGDAPAIDVGPIGGTISEFQCTVSGTKNG